MSVFRFRQPQEPRNLLWGLTIGYCIFSKCYGMFFKISRPRILAFYKTCNFFIFFTSNVSIQVFQPNRTSPLGFDNKLLEMFYGHALVFSFHYPKFLKFWYASCNFFFKFFEICQFLGFSSLKSHITSSSA